MKLEYRIEGRWPSQDDWNTLDNFTSLKAARKYVKTTEETNKLNYINKQSIRIIRVIETVVR